MNSSARQLEPMKKEKQGSRLASFAPVLLPIARLPKLGFGNLTRDASQF